MSLIIIFTRIYTNVWWAPKWFVLHTGQQLELKMSLTVIMKDDNIFAQITRISFGTMSNANIILMNFTDYKKTHNCQMSSNNFSPSSFKICSFLLSQRQIKPTAAAPHSESFGHICSKWKWHWIIRMIPKIIYLILNGMPFRAVDKLGAVDYEPILWLELEIWTNIR